MSPTPNPSWIVLRDRAVRGDIAAAAELSQQIWIRAYRDAYSVLHDPGAAKDVAQDTWIKVLPRWPFFENDGQFKKFVDITARNGAIDELRRRRRGGGPPLRAEGDDIGGVEPPDPGLGPEDTASNNERRRRLYVCIRQLDDLERKIVLLRQVGYTNLEIAATLTPPLTNQKVGVVYHQAAQKLRRCMEKEVMMPRPDVMEAV